MNFTSVRKSYDRVIRKTRYLDANRVNEFNKWTPKLIFTWLLFNLLKQKKKKNDLLTVVSVVPGCNLIGIAKSYVSNKILTFSI